MSHEIRTPLSSIIGITNIQIQKNADSPDEAFLRISDASNILLTIINDILDLAKVEAGKMEIVPAKYDVAGMIADTVQLNLMQVGNKPIEFKLSVDEAVPVSLIGDELRIKQILNNLLSNAFKYTNEGYVRLSISTKPSSIDDEVYIIFNVAESGIGMTSEQIETLFTEYIRANSQENRAIEGTGLGMSITNHLIGQMNGKYYVESQPGVGSLFTVLIPQKASGYEILGIKAARNMEELKKVPKKNILKIKHEPMPYGSILVVDDAESNLYVAKGLLAQYDLHVETANSGQAAIKKVQAGNVYDIIFMDHMMPLMDGLEATKIIKEGGYSQPIVVLSANTILGQEDIFLNSGFDAFLPKPIEMDLLDKCLKRFVRDKQPQHVIDAAHETKENALTRYSSMEELEKIFLRDAQKVVDVMESAVSDDYSDIKTYTTSVHLIKSVLYNIGRTALSEMAHELEKAARANKPEFVRRKTPEFITLLKEVMELTRPDDPEDGIADDADFIREQFAAIRKACENYDINTINHTLDILSKKQFSNKTRRLIDEIKINVLRGEYETAAKYTNF
jgi:CheY-like chemotaxis protein/two-component sensor histidine kinase